MDPLPSAHQGAIAQGLGTSSLFDVIWMKLQEWFLKEEKPLKFT